MKPRRQERFNDKQMKKLADKLAELSQPDPNTGCINYTGYVANSRYGVISGYGAGRPIFAHRASYMINIGPIPVGLCVCHKCDNRLCVNAEHLFIGTYRDNQQDMIAKGRKNSRKMPLIATHAETGEELYFESINAAGRAGFIRSSISGSSKNNWKHKGYYWKFLPKALSGGASNDK